jgi:hypothetical protein
MDIPRNGKPSAIGIYSKATNSVSATLNNSALFPACLGK